MITIDKSQQQALINQSRKFADKHTFRFEIAYYSPQGDYFIVEMIRKDIQIVFNNDRFHPDEFDVDFLNYDCLHPTASSEISGLVDELKSLFGEIPNITISEQQ